MKQIIFSVVFSLAFSISALAADFSPGQPVVAIMENGYFDATILEVFSDGTAQIQYIAPHSPTQVVPLSGLAHIVYSENGFATRDAVTGMATDGPFDATILELYDNGMARIQLVAPHSPTHVVPLSSISKE